MAILSSGILLSEGSSGSIQIISLGTLAPNAGTQESINTGDYTSGVLIHQITKDASTISWNINGNVIQSSASVGNVGNSVTTTIGWAYGNEYWDGHVAEVIYINKKIEDDESMKIRAYLANKWGMAATVDSDRDGIVDASDQAPVNQDRVVVDLSDTIDSTLGTTTGLDSLESDLRFWLDANNVNGVNNDGIADGSDQDIVFDLSPHQNDTTPYLNRSDYRPTLRKGVLNGKDVLEFAGPLDVLVTKNDLGVADINENSEISLFVVARNHQRYNLSRFPSYARWKNGNVLAKR